uniref:PB1 domain-containing protein n=1 Tax=Globodera rostochiensis TaxID=31243 RepID=A0A914HLF8_GLORO
METPAGIDEVYKPHECRIHEAVFDTLSKPIHSTNDKRTHRSRSSPSPLKGRNQQQNGHRLHITWNHFGQKAKFHLDPNCRDLFEALHRSVHEELPNFRGNLAFKDYDKREVLIRCDRQIREAAASSRGGNRLHIYTTLSDTPSHHLAASELGTLSGSRPSSRVPPLRRPTTADSSTPLLRAPEGRGRRRVDEENFLQRAREAVGGRSDDEERRHQSGTVEPERTQTLSLAYPFWPAGAFPIFFRGCWIGPNKFVYGGGWGGWGPIPSRKNWHSVVGGGRPPW